MKFAWRYAVKELFAHRSFTLLTVVSMVFGLFGILSTDHFEKSARASIAQKSRELLSADLFIELRRPLTPNEIELIAQHTRSSTGSTKGIHFYSMLSYGSQSLLTQVHVIDSKYPLIGTFELEPKSSFQSLFDSKHILLTQDVAQRLGTKPNTQVNLAGKTFQISGQVIKDSSQSQGFFALAPSVYISQDSFESLGLAQKGSTLRYNYAYLYPPKTDLDALKSSLEKDLRDPSIQILTPKSSQENLSRLVGYLSDYLSLVSLVGVFLTAAAGSFLFRTYLEQRKKDIAILLCIGTKRSSIIYIYVLQALLIGLTSAIIAYICSIIALPLLSNYLSAFVPVDIQAHMSPSSIVLTLLLALLMGPIFNIPNLRELQSISPSKLFHEDASSSKTTFTSSFLGALPSLIFLFCLSCYVSDSYRVGAGFFLSIVASVLVLSFLFLGLTKFVPIPNRSSPRKHGIQNVVRNKVFSSALFISVGLVTLLIGLIPQIKDSILFDFSPGTTTNKPDLFLFDIQEEQISLLETFSKTHHYNLETLTPLVHARLLEVNGKSFDRMDDLEQTATREEQKERDFRNRGFNLTYRSHTTESETILKGQPFSGTKSEIAEISVEEKFAKRIHLNLQDTLLFEISGLKIMGKIVNFRKVRWASFQPNFFVVFEPGFLEDAPKTYLANLSNVAHPSQAQADLFKSLPSISALSVQSTVEKITAILNQMTQAMQLASYLVFAAGLLVMIALCNYQLTQKTHERALLKAIGASYSWIRKSSLWEFASVIFTAILSGAALSFILSVILSYILYDRISLFVSQSFIVAVGSVALTCFLMMCIAVEHSIFSKKSVNLFE